MVAVNAGSYRCFIVAYCCLILHETELGCNDLIGSPSAGENIGIVLGPLRGVTCF